jgi:phosphoribosylformylglycinamidine synthase
MFRLYQPLSPQTEIVYYSSWTIPPSDNDLIKLKSIIPGDLHSSSTLNTPTNNTPTNNTPTNNTPNNTLNVVEYGPLLSMITPWSDIAKNICHSAGLTNLERIEKVIRTTNPNWKDAFDPLQMQVYKTSEIGLTSWTSPPLPTDYQINYQTIFNIDVKDFKKYNQIYGLGMDDRDILFYTLIYKKLNRPATNLELYDLGQSNSEHSRHWTFNSAVYLDGDKMPKTMFQLVKEPYKKNPNNSLVAFSDNSSVIKGFSVQENNQIRTIHFCFTAETHNFPTGICPFPGASTGIGGRIRDVIATGRGASMIAGTAGYSVGNFNIDKNDSEELRNQKILIEASNGASDYGNKVGEPIILGYTRIFSNKSLKLSFRKPIMFTGGLGHIYHENLYKEKVKPGLMIIRAGGPTYRIGLGGGSASSRTEANKDLDYQAVQRGDPEMENRLTRFVSRCAKLTKNPILSIHDQGAGGMANVSKEIVAPLGGLILLDEVRKGDPTLSPLEIWCSESQEQITFLAEQDQYPLLVKIAKEEGLVLELIGSTEDKPELDVSYQGRVVGSFNLELMLEKIPIKILRIEPRNPISMPFLNQKRTNDFLLDLPPFKELLEKVLSNPTVGSKSFLTNKVDRSVSGLIVQQQTIGKYQVPLSDYALVSSSYYPNPDTHLYTGTVLSIGEQPLKGINDPERMVEMTFGEMLLNMVGVKIDSIQDIKISGNWMWAPKEQGYGYTLYKAVERLSKLCMELGPIIDGGKDSLSMTSRTPDGIKIISPPTLVLSSYAPVPDINKRVQSGFVETLEASCCILIDFSNGQNRIGGSILAQEYFPNSGLEIDKDLYPRMDDPKLFRKVWAEIQSLIQDNLILSLHDRSDGGLLTTLIEMSLPNNIGFKIIENSYPKEKKEIIKFCFNEELGLVVQVFEKHLELIQKKLSIKPNKIAVITNTSNIELPSQLEYQIRDLRHIWQSRSYQLEKLQANPFVIKQEYDVLNDNFRGLSEYRLGNIPIECMLNKVKYDGVLRALILRQDGSNGDREMTSAFTMAGFETTNAKTNQLINEINLMDFDCLVMVGGFSNGDVFGSACGWAQTILQNEILKTQFNAFFNHPMKYSLGVCNGFQLMTRLGLFGKSTLNENDSGRFESRWINLTVSSDKPLLKPLNELVWGCWIAHGEGKLNIDRMDASIGSIKYESSKYPHNPNGSDDNIAGLISENGRHLGMMPHPERSFLMYQSAWDDPNVKIESNYRPWFCLFQSYYNEIAKLKKIN